MDCQSSVIVPEWTEMAPKCKIGKMGKIGIPVFFIFFSLVIAGALGVSTASTVVVNGTYVKGDFYCDTIQEAVDMANDGDTIIVCPGTYRGNIVVDKPVSILSYGGASETVIEAKDNRKNIVIISANKVNISGFTIKNFKAEGIYQKYADDCNLSGNNIYSTRNGIHLFSSNNNIISYNTVNLNDNSGILLEYSSNNEIVDNNASNNMKDGIGLFDSNNNTIKGNTANSNKQYHGIELSSSNNNKIVNNNASNNFQSGITLFESSNNNTIIGNTAKSNNNDGIYIEFSHNNSILNLTLQTRINNIMELI